MSIPTTITPTRTVLNIARPTLPIQQVQPVPVYQARQVQQVRTNPRPVAYTVVHTEREEVPFPDIPHDQLVAEYVAGMQRGGQCHPRLISIYQGFAIFRSGFDFRFNTKTKIAYEITCRVPLTDAVLQKEQPVDLLYCTESIPFLTFRASGWTDKNGYGITSPNY